MQSFVLLLIAGVIAQLVDGSLGMAFGVTSTALLLMVGVAPALASTSVHLAEVGTMLASGLSHWRFGNVDWSMILWMGIPGGIGAYVGAVLLTSLSAEAAEPVVAIILFGLGVYFFGSLRLQPRQTGCNCQTSTARGPRALGSDRRYCRCPRRRRLGADWHIDLAIVGTHGAPQGRGYCGHERVYCLGMREHRLPAELEPRRDTLAHSYRAIGWRRDRRTDRGLDCASPRRANLGYGCGRLDYPYQC
jgi:hypothetical protein